MANNDENMPNDAKVWAVVNWCESPDSEPGCFGRWFAAFNDAWNFAKADASEFKRKNEIKGELALDEDNAHIYLDWCGVTHHWNLEQLNKG